MTDIVISLWIFVGVAIVMIIVLNLIIELLSIFIKEVNNE